MKNESSRLEARARDGGGEESYGIRILNLSHLYFSSYVCRDVTWLSFGQHLALWHRLQLRNFLMFFLVLFLLLSLLGFFYELEKYKTRTNN